MSYKAKHKILLFLLLSFSYSCWAFCQESAKPKLFVFVSFSMPEQSLKNWAWQVNRIGGTLVIRGFYRNSIKETTKQVMTLFCDKTTLNIDPEGFERFNIKSVPSVVVVNSYGQFDVISGDITLDAALGKILAKGSPEVSKTTQALLAKARV